MLFWLKKAVSYWLMPLPFCIALMVVGILLLCFRRQRRMGQILLIGGALLLVLFSNKQVGGALLRPIETQYSAVPELTADQPLPSPLASCRAIVVLGGGHTDAISLPATGKLSYSALSRIVEAVRLAHVLPHATLIVSGPAIGHGETHASVLAAAAVSLGIDRSRIVTIDTARDTDDEVQAVKKQLGTATPFVLVTSAWHMPRAMGLMRHAGLEPLPCPADFLALPDRDTRPNDWLCDTSGLRNSTCAVYERLGTAWARLQGKIGEPSQK